MPPLRPGGSFIMARVIADAQMARPSSAHEPPIHKTEPIWEARILSLEQRSRAGRHTSRDASVCSSIAVDDDNPGRSGLGLNYSRGSAGKWQHHEGAITYYSGAPFCTDLSGDPADLSPTTRTPSST
ncbi:uncharacterized protein FRV6_13057 [Fusarium oxysporum]|uniref:Uncharacterized protein n=1 Tax=Fusarium oxysporum TaxID=5507 RepID=A0A2H3U4B7_FUSOX|nr:uncharacterized protein FRV6_13057 [Fusarium oxysporum]